MVNELKGKADIIIAATHLGIYNINNDSDVSKGSKRVAANVNGIDLIIDGHTHSLLKKPVIINNTPIVQAKHWGMYVGKAMIQIQDKKIKDFKWELVSINHKNRIKKDGKNIYEAKGPQFEEDQELLSLLTPYVEKVDEVLSQEIGETKKVILSDNVRKQETALGNMVADAMVWYTKNLKTDFAVQNGGGIRASIPEGKIQKKVIYEVLPFDNSIITLELSGQQVQKLFDYIATIPSGKGAFAQVSGEVKFTLNYSTKKCENILINGKPIDPDKTYVVATNSYMASDGDDYAVFKTARNKYDTSVFQRDVVIEYIIKNKGNVNPAVEKRIAIKN